MMFSYCHYTLLVLKYYMLFYLVIDQYHSLIQVVVSNGSLDRMNGFVNVIGHFVELSELMHVVRPIQLEKEIFT